MTDPRSVVILEGGLGNQLFQYAFALYSSRAAAVLDNRRRVIWGEPLNTVLRPGSWRPVRQHELLRAWQCPRVPRLQRTLNAGWHRALPVKSRSNVVREADGCAPLEPVHTRRVLLYDGYFQDERYLAPVQDRILNGLHPDLLTAHPDVALDGSEVAVSFRLGDDYRAFGVVLPSDYYARAIGRLMEGIRTPRLHVCGDDPLEVMRLLRDLDLSVEIVDHMGEGPVSQLRVLASAPRVAIANSTFAWWGAWLGDVLGHAQKRQVFCPQSWLAGPESIMPERWIRVPFDVTARS